MFIADLVIPQWFVDKHLRHRKDLSLGEFFLLVVGWELEMLELMGEHFMRQQLVRTVVLPLIEKLLRG